MLVDLDEVFVNYALEHGYVSAERVEKCRRVQRREEKKGRSYYLAQIMIQRRYLSCEDFLLIENALEQKLYECARCKIRYARHELREGSRECRGCKKRIVIDGREGLSMAEILASRDPRDLTISLVAQKDGARRTSPRSAPAETRTSQRQRPPRSSTRMRPERTSERHKRSRRSKRTRLNRDALQVEAEDLAGLDRYEIIEEIGRGGMGLVFKARQLDIDRVCALKVIKAGPQVPEVQINRFVQEGKSAARLAHPNIITIFDSGRYRDTFFVAMEFIDGQAVSQILSAQGPLTIGQALSIMRDVLAAVDYAHEHGVVHRDLKPANILVERERGRARLIDFGLAKDHAQGLGLTQEGQILGSPFYLSPEQTRGHSKDVDGRADIFALGVILYEMLTGRRPFSGRSAAEVYGKILHGRPTPPAVLNPEVDPELQDIILKALAKDRRERFQTAEEFAARLEQYAESRAEQVRRPTRRMAGVSAPTRGLSGRNAVGGRPGGSGRGHAPKSGTGRIPRPKSTSARATAQRAGGPRSERALSEPRRSPATPILWGLIGCGFAVLIGFGLLAQESAPREDPPPDAPPQALATPTPGEPYEPTPGPPPVDPLEGDQRSVGERAYDRAEAYRREHPDDLLGALASFRDAAGRGGPWGDKAAEQVGLLERRLRNAVADAERRVRALVLKKQFKAALSLAEQSETRYLDAPGGEALAGLRGRVEADAVAHAGEVARRSREHAAQGELAEALSVLQDYGEIGLDAADALVYAALEDLHRQVQQARNSVVEAALEAREQLDTRLRGLKALLRERRHAEAESSLAELEASPWTARSRELRDLLIHRRRELEQARAVVAGAGGAGPAAEGLSVTIGGLQARVRSVRAGSVELVLRRGGTMTRSLEDLSAPIVARIFASCADGKTAAGALARAVFLLVEGAAEEALDAWAEARKLGADPGEHAEDFVRLEQQVAARRAAEETEPDESSPAAERPKLERVKDDAAMVLIPAGAFLMGIDQSRIESERYDEIPGRQIELSAFRIDRYEVTNRQYALFLAWIRRHASKAHKYCHALEPADLDHTPLGWDDPRYAGDPFPVRGVCWYDAYAFASWAGKRLPTEAEWERAARSADGRTYAWGTGWDPQRTHGAERLFGRPLPDRAAREAFDRFREEPGRPLLARVDALPQGRSQEGLFHVSGNVAELTADWYEEAHYQTSKESTDPRGPRTGSLRVVRGGSFMDHDARQLTTTAREALPPSERRPWVGFRCALSADQPAPRRLR